MNFIVKTLLLLLAPMPSLAFAQAAPPAFEARGRLVEAHRTALQSRIERLRSTILDTLRIHAPDLVARLDPAAPPVAQGYQLLPRLLPEMPQPADTGRRANLYSWPWTDTLIIRADRGIDSLDSLLSVTSKSRSIHERLVGGFNQAVADRRLIDAHVEHNWFWQRAFAADTARFGVASQMIEKFLRGEGAAVVPTPAVPRIRMVLEDTGGGPVTIRVPIVTDIEDTSFVRAAQATIERLWSTQLDGREHRVRLDVRLVSPRSLYCPTSNSTCVPPARGATLDLTSHIARFPADLAVLTTGGTQPHVLGGRATILGPRDLAARTLGHEFGHILGFEDAYIRGFRSLGADGYAIIELVPDRADIMAASGFGSAQPRHFQQVIANLKRR